MCDPNCVETLKFYAIENSFILNLNLNIDVIDRMNTKTKSCSKKNSNDHKIKNEKNSVKHMFTRFLLKER